MIEMSAWLKHKPHDVKCSYLLFGTFVNLPPHKTAVPYSFGKFRGKIKKGNFWLWNWQHPLFININQQSIVVGFYGNAGRFTQVYLNWLLKAFPKKQQINRLSISKDRTIFTYEEFERVLIHIEETCQYEFMKKILSNIQSKSTKFKLQTITKEDILRVYKDPRNFYEELSMDSFVTKWKDEDSAPKYNPLGENNESKIYKINLDSGNFYRTDVGSLIPIKVWNRVLSEIAEKVKKLEQEQLLKIQEKVDEERKKIERHYEDQEERNDKLLNDPEYINRKNEELNKMREKLEKEKRHEEKKAKKIREQRRLIWTALKELETSINYNQIKFAEMTMNNKLSLGDIKKSQVEFPIFFRILGPLFTAEKIQMDMTTSIFFNIENPLKCLKTVGSEARVTTMLVSKLASSLRATTSRLTLNETFEERQKLMEMLRRELDDVAENWGIRVSRVAIEEIFLEDPAFQRSLIERRQMELQGGKQIELKRVEANKVRIKGRQKAENIVMEAKADMERELNRVKLEIERATIELQTKKIESETLLIEKKLEAERILISAQGKAAELKFKKETMSDNLIKLKLIRELPLLMSHLIESLQTAILSPEQYMDIITGNLIFDAINKQTSKGFLDQKEVIKGELIDGS